MGTLIQELATSGTAVHPIMFVQALRTLFPQFAEQDRNGFMQQDAEECCNPKKLIN
jgi:ubiquitin carboxyl-terminal hydrolase 14